jgi:hypothetical protein
MLIFDDLFFWEGWGGKLRLASGSCRLRVFDLREETVAHVKHIRPIIAIASDVPEGRMSIKSCAGHIATKIVETFDLDPHRMIYVEYYPSTRYGPSDEHEIPEKYEWVELTWHDRKAIQPKWRLLKPPLLDVVKELMAHEKGDTQLNGKS